MLRQNSDEFLAEEKVDTFNDDDASVSDFDEEEDIGNNEDYLQTEDVDALEANNQNQKNMNFVLEWTLVLMSLHIKLIESMEAIMVDHRNTLLF